MKVLRVLTRVYLAPDDLDKAVAFYERLFSVNSHSGPPPKNEINFYLGYPASWQIASIVQYRV